MYANPDPGGASERMKALGKRRGGAAMVTQMVFTQQWTRQNAAIADKAMSAWRGLTFARDLIDYSSYSKMNFLLALDKTDLAGIIFSFWFNGSVAGATSGAHTIAFFRTMQTRGGATGKATNRLSAFDPNFGECLIVDGNMPAWVDDMLLNYGPCLTQWMRGFRKS